MKKRISFFRKSTRSFLGMILVASVFVSCVSEGLFRDDLPDANSKVDTVPPTADFSFASDQMEFRIVNFTNLSVEASMFLWDFGNGNTSTDKDPSFTFPGEGSFLVKLTAIDGNGAEDVIEKMVNVVDILVPVFQCPSFECSPRTPWAGDGGETSTFTGSSGPTPPDGGTGAKISSSSQWLDQTILVTPETEYEITFFYVSVTGSANGGKILFEDKDNGVVLKQEGIPASDLAGAYQEISYKVTTGLGENLRVRIDYDGFEARYDLISIRR